MMRSVVRQCRVGVLAVVGLAVLIAGCETVPYTWQGSAADAIDESLRQAEADSARGGAVPSEISDALLPPIQLRTPKGGAIPLEPRFDFNVNLAPARRVYMGLVEGTRYGMVVHPDVKGLVSLNLKNVTVPEAVNVLRDVYGYHYRREGERFYILSQGMQTRIFPVNYLNLSRKGTSRTHVTAGELTQTGTPGKTATGPGGAGRATRANMQVETESKADFWYDLKATLETIIGDKNGRSVVVNPQAGVVIVRAMPQELIVVEDYLGITHSTVNRQVVLEAKILEVELSDGFQAGINWSKLGTWDDYTLTGSQVGGGTIFNGDSTSDISGNSFTLDPGSGLFDPIGGTLTSAFGGVFTLAVQGANFSGFIEAFQGQGEVHVLSSPRVSTVNNQKAVIKVGGDEFFVTGVTSTSVTNSLGGTDFVPNVELTPFFSGIALDVTPQIDDDNNVILHIHPSVSEVEQQNKVFIIFDSDFNLPLAISTIQESDNVVRARSGQVVVIGGLMKEGSTDADAAVPLLGDIPIIGNLFKHKRVTRIKKELVILLKPTVVTTGQQWNDMIKDTHGRMNKLKRGNW